MSRPSSSVTAALLVGLIACAVTSFAAAQGFPNRPVQLVVAYPPGGTGDVIARLIAGRLSSSLGQPVRVENRTGASGAVGARLVAKAAADGHTLLIGQTAEVVANPILMKDAGYDPVRDFQPIAFLAMVPVVLAVPANAPYTDLQQLLATARASKRGLAFASGGPGTTGHLAGELLRLRTQARLIHVPVDGASAAFNELLDGRVDFYFAPYPLAIGPVKDGKVKLLATASVKRMVAEPTLPTVAEETGIRSFDIVAWVGVFAPRGTPSDIVARLNREINQALAQPEVRQHFIADGAEIVPMSVGQFEDFVRAEARRYSDLLNEDFCSKVFYGGCEGFSAGVQ
jgi:tripartite-type tricarboxylate transporter receptor subunit TctC